MGYDEHGRPSCGADADLLYCALIRLIESEHDRKGPTEVTPDRLQSS